VVALTVRGAVKTDVAHVIEIAMRMKYCFALRP
jgi:hypothetical protein